MRQADPSFTEWSGDRLGVGDCAPSGVGRAGPHPECLARRQFLSTAALAACAASPMAVGAAVVSPAPLPRTAAASESRADSAAAADLIPLAYSEQTHAPFVLPLLELVAKAAGLRWRHLPRPWPRALLGAELGEHLVFGLSRNPKRERQMLFSQPVFVSHGWLVVDKDRPFAFRQPGDLRGKTLCTARGAAFGPPFDALKGKLFQVETGGNNLAGRVRMLARGRCDAVLATHRGSQSAALQRRLLALPEGAQLRVLPKPLVTETIHFAVARSSPLAALMPRLDEAIRRQRAAIQQLIDSDV